MPDDLDADELTQRLGMSERLRRDAVERAEKAEAEVERMRPLPPSEYEPVLDEYRIHRERIAPPSEANVSYVRADIADAWFAENKRLRAKLSHIASMAGNPDPAEACRLIIDEAAEDTT